MSAEFSPRRRPILRRMRVDHMLNNPPPPVPWLAEPVLVRGGLTLIAGRHGEGKSMLAQALAVAVVNGTAAAGITATSGSVLIIDGENGENELHRRVRLLGLNASAAGRFELYEADGFSLGRDLIELERLMERHRPDLLVLDSFRSLWPGGDENDSGQVSAVLDPLRSSVRSANVATVVLHHLGKNSGQYRGSSAIGASVELAFKLDRAEGDPEPHRRRLSCFKSRPAAEPAPIWIELKAEDDALSIKATDAFAGGTSVSNAVEAEVLRAVTDGARRRSEICAALGRGPKDGTVSRALKALTEDICLVRVGDEYELPASGSKVPTPIALGTLEPNAQAGSQPATQEDAIQW